MVCITGNVGAGKSSILSAITGEMNCIKGSIALQDVTTGFGYVSQNAWLQRGTIRNNIVWGQVYDESFYKSVIHACGLVDDLKQLGGDDTYVGDKGMTLSGGQRMRVALARAVYQNKQIYLLDDVLSSLDAHVANHVIKYCIFGLLASKTRLIVTENRAVLRRASQILHFDSGLVTAHDPAKAYTSDLSDEEDACVEVKLSSSPKEGVRRAGKRPVRRSTTRVDELAPVQDHLEERMEMGSLKGTTIVAYWRAVTGRLGFAVLLSVLLMQISRNSSDVVLAEWVAATTADNSTNATAASRSGQTLLGVYCGVVILNSILTLGRSFLFAYGGIKAAILIHDKLLRGVIRVSEEL